MKSINLLGLFNGCKQALTRKTTLRIKIKSPKWLIIKITGGMLGYACFVAYSCYTLYDVPLKFTSPQWWQVVITSTCLTILWFTMVYGLIESELQKV
jgi:hypothetical protein